MLMGNNVRKPGIACDRKIIIIMPVANEEDTMSQLLRELLALPFENLYIYPIIDSCSKDDTEKIIREEEAKTHRIKCIFHTESTGVISCYLEGFRRALRDGADFIIEMDGGGSHQPAELSQFIEGLEQGYDCVWGSRFASGGGIRNLSLYRRILSGGGTMLANLVLGTKLKDMTSGYEGFKRHVLENMDLDKFLSKGHIYQTEMRFYCRNYKTKEVPIHYVGGKSSLQLKSVSEALKVLFTLKKNEAFVMKAPIDEGR